MPVLQTVEAKGTLGPFKASVVSFSSHRALFTPAA
jgi:hypothetical protein